MKPLAPLLERRRQHLRAKIAEQRSQLASELSALQDPLHAFEMVREVAQQLRRHAPLMLLVAACLSFAAMRGGLLSKTLRIVQLANTSRRWWAIVMFGLRLLRSWRTVPAS